MWNEDSRVNSLMVHQVVYQSFLAMRHKNKSNFSTWLNIVENFAIGNLTVESPSTFAALSLLKPHLAKIATKNRQFILATSNSVEKCTHTELEPAELLLKLKVF